jgi:hypothetical protein
MKEFYEIEEEATALAEDAIADGEGAWVRPSVIGLDPRCGGKLYVCLGFIACSNNDIRSLDYYGGFEYVAPEYRAQVGEYTFFSADDERVQDHIAAYYNDGEEDER